MSLSKDELFKQAVKLSPMEKAHLVELLLSSFELTDKPDIDTKWASEAESRLEAYSNGFIEKVSINDVFSSLDV